MQKAEERAAALHQKGYNCAQSVFGAFAEECGVDFGTAMRISSPFGGGIAQLRGICGAFTGMCMAMGAWYDKKDPMDKEGRDALGALLQAMEQEFRSVRGSVQCSELLAMADEVGGRAQFCGDLVRRAAALAEREMRE